MDGMGVDEELIRLGAKRGDTIQIMDYMFQFKEDEYLDEEELNLNW